MGNLFSSEEQQPQAPRSGGRINKRQKTGVHLSSMQETMICSQCDQVIEGSYTKAINKYFHLDCFQCCKCHKPIRTSKFYRIDDQVYCQHDYDQFVNPDIDICAVCLERILGGGRSFESKDHCYHEKCFRCCSCGTQLKPAQEFFTRSASGAGGKGLEVYCKSCRPTTPISKATVTTETFSSKSTDSTSSSSSKSNATDSDTTTSSGSTARKASQSKSGAKSKKDTTLSSSSSSSKKKKTTTVSADYDESKEPHTCAACNKTIDGTAMEALNNTYHPACFVCAKCKVPFLHNKFFVDNSTNAVYCRADFPYKLMPESQAKAFDDELHSKQERIAKRKRQGSR